MCVQRLGYRKFHCGCSGNCFLCVLLCQIVLLQYKCATQPVFNSVSTGDLQKNCSETVCNVLTINVKVFLIRTRRTAVCLTASRCCHYRKYINLRNFAPACFAFLRLQVMLQYKMLRLLQFGIFFYQLFGQVTGQFKQGFIVYQRCQPEV